MPPPFLQRSYGLRLRFEIASTNAGLCRLSLRKQIHRHEAPPRLIHSDGPHGVKPCGARALDIDCVVVEKQDAIAWTIEKLRRPVEDLAVRLHVTHLERQEPKVEGAEQ